MLKNVFLFFILIHVYSAYSQSDLNDSETQKPGAFSQLLIVGHRGGFDSNLPENSLVLFDFALNMACLKPIAIEFDIRKSASGSLFIMHDSTVDRTTNGKGTVTLLSDQYIKTLLLKDRNGNLTSEKVPLLLDVLHHFHDKNIVLMLDVKGNIYPEVSELVNQMQMESKCIILTFNPVNTELVKEIAGSTFISALVVNNDDWKSLLKLQIPVQQLIAYVTNQTPPKLISEIHRNKVMLMTDMSESIRNNSNYYETDYYKAYLSKMKLSIMITDFPVYVNKIFCE